MAMHCETADEIIGKRAWIVQSCLRTDMMQTLTELNDQCLELMTLQARTRTTGLPLLLRDLPLMRQLAARTEFTAALSIPTLEEKAWRATEPHTPHPRKRIEAVAELNRAGIQTGVLVAPLMPGINDSPAQVEKLLAELGEAGARNVGGIGLHLRGEVRGIWFDWLSQYRPDLVPLYEELFEKGAYMPAAERKRLAGLVRGLERPARFRSTGDSKPQKAERPRRPRRPKPRARQEALF